MTTRTVDNNQDIIDSRDVIARLEELTSERGDLLEALNESESAEDGALNQAPDADSDLAKLKDERAVVLAAWDEDNGEELAALKAFASEGEDNFEDWQHGAILIRESYFVDYCQFFAEDIGDMPKDLPYYMVIDWDATARNLRMDYTEIEFDGVTYLARRPR